VHLNLTLTIQAIAVVLNFAAFVMRDDIRLRQVAIASNIGYVIFGVMAGSWLPVLLHGTLAPLNFIYLRELIRERALVERAMQVNEVSAEWLMRFMHRHDYRAGDVIFRRGDAADRMFFLADGHIRLEEIDREIFAGALLGEIGIFSPAGVRTQTATALTDITTYELHRNGVLAFYRRDPAFAIYLTRLITRRLVEDIAISESAAERLADG
jgi:CRP-like cAMP-binding protein